MRERGGGEAIGEGLGRGKKSRLLKPSLFQIDFFLNKVINHLICFNFLKVSFNRVAHSAKMLVSIIEALHLKK